MLTKASTTVAFNVDSFMLRTIKKEEFMGVNVLKEHKYILLVCNLILKK